MRNIATVTDQIMSQIPDDYSDRTALVNRINSTILENRHYNAPEVTEASLWYELCRLLDSVLGEPDTAWKEAIAAILADE